MSDSTFKWAAQYAALGWYVVPCHGCIGEKCTCRNAECPTPGKHPILGGWQHKATTSEEELEVWFDGSKPRNVGVALGEKSGIVDIEYDDEEGRVTAQKLGLDRLYTPTYTSKRSTHRIVKWDSKMPAQAVIKIMGLEIRIGGGSRGAQSIMPPSMHCSGASYSWVEGMSPLECEVAEMPHELMVMLTNHDPGTELAARKEPASAIVRGEVAEGGRHNALLRMAARMAMRMDDLHCPIEYQDCLLTLDSINKTQCSPPKQRIEVEKIWRDSHAWAIRKRASGEPTEEEKTKALSDRLAGRDKEDDAEGEGGLAAAAYSSQTGLQFRDGEWFPGEWRLKVIHGDPAQFCLTIPVWRTEKDGELKKVAVTINMDAETYMSAAKVAKAILEATHTVVVNGVPEEWHTMWNGSAAKKGREAVRGLKAKLMDTRTEEAASAENCRFAAVAQWLLDVLDMIEQPAEDGGDEADPERNQPDVTGMPSWVHRDGQWELWFSWTRVWEMADRGRRNVESRDTLTLKRMLLAAVGDRELSVGRFRGSSNCTRRYIRFQARHLAALAEIAAGKFAADSVTAFSVHAHNVIEAD